MLKDDEAKIEVYSNICLFRKPIKRKTPDVITKRGRIKGFEKKPRNRLAFHLLSQPYLPRHMITVTYPKFYSADPRDWKRHLDYFGQYLIRTFPGCYFTWKLEPQKRGAPHFHLIGDLRTTLKKRQIYQWASRTWAKIVGATGVQRKKHEKAGTRVDFLADKSGKKAKIYIYKYVAKEIHNLPEWSCPGRFWGVINKKCFPEKRHTTLYVDLKSFIIMRRIMRRLIERRNKHYANKLRYMLNYFVILKGDAVFQYAMKNYMVHAMDTVVYMPKNDTTMVLENNNIHNRVRDYINGTYDIVTGECYEQ